MKPQDNDLDDDNESKEEQQKRINKKFGDPTSWLSGKLTPSDDIDTNSASSVDDGLKDHPYLNRK